MRKTATVALAGLALVLAQAQPSAAQTVKVGTLHCGVSGSIGWIVTSRSALNCLFVSFHGYTERYRGSIRKIGLDVGATRGGELAWMVLAPTAGPRRGALSGEYVGVEASATVGAGGGANALVGGFGRSITLQPLSLEAESGVALSAGVESMSLRFLY